MDINYKELRIRNATLNDVTQLQTWWNDGKVMAHAGFPNGLNITEEKIIHQINQDNETKRRLILEFKSKSIGEMCYSQVNENTVEIGIKICNFEYQNQGLGRLYLSMLIQELFKTYTKIILDTDLENKRAQHVYETLGFTKLRINVDSWKNQLNEFRSSVDYEITPEQFKSTLDY